MTKGKAWNIVKQSAKLLVCVALLYFVFQKIDPKIVWQYIKDSDYTFLFFAFLAFFCSIIISSFRLHAFFKGIDLQLPQAYNFKLYLLGMFYNLFIPGGIGGDGYKVYFLRKKYAIKGRRILLAIFFDRLSGLWALCLITAALIHFIPSFGIPKWLPITLVVLGTLVYYGIMKRFFSDYAKNFIEKHLWAIGVQSLQVSSVIAILFALHFEGKYSPYLLLFLVSQLVAIFPITPGGLGSREMLFMFGSEYLKVDSNHGAIISLLSYFIAALISFFGAYFVFHPKGIGEQTMPTQSGLKEIEESAKKVLEEV